MENTPTQRPLPRTGEKIASYISQWQESGKSKKAFCRESGLNYMTFIGWSSKKEEKKKEKISPAFGFVQIKVKPQPKESSVFAEIKTTHGFVLSLYSNVSAEYLRNLLRP